MEKNTSIRFYSLVSILVIFYGLLSVMVGWGQMQNLELGGIAIVIFEIIFIIAFFPFAFVLLFKNRIKLLITMISFLVLNSFFSWYTDVIHRFRGFYDFSVYLPNKYAIFSFFQIPLLTVIIISFSILFSKDSSKKKQLAIILAIWLVLIGATFILDNPPKF